MKNKFIIFLVIISTLIGTIPFGIYYLYFKGSLSTTNSDWGNFGSFIGGTTGALLSTLSLLVLIYTLHITIRNSQEQISIQQQNHEAQMDLQKEIHNRERDLTRFSMNINLLYDHIDTLNKKLDSKIYRYKNQALNEKVSTNEDGALRLLLNKLESLLVKDKDAGLQSVHQIISDLEITYMDEIIPFSNIIGIVNNETNERFRENYIYIFLSRTNRERTFWLTCYGINESKQVKDAVFKNLKLHILPESIMDLLKKHNRMP